MEDDGKVIGVENLDETQKKIADYDTETGFCYLQTRYYDPMICRFINADNYELVSQLAGSKELNMYAYGRNNPVMYTDETGEGFFLAILLVGLIAGAVMNELGYGRSDPQWEKAHRALMKYKKGGGYFDKYRDLLEFIEKVLGR